VSTSTRSNCSRRTILIRLRSTTGTPLLEPDATVTAARAHTALSTAHGPLEWTETFSARGSPHPTSAPPCTPAPAPTGLTPHHPGTTRGPGSYLGPGWWPPTQVDSPRTTCSRALNFAMVRPHMAHRATAGPRRPNRMAPLPPPRQVMPGTFQGDVQPRTGTLTSRTRRPRSHPQQIRPDTKLTRIAGYGLDVGTDPGPSESRSGEKPTG